ncbi:MAG: hypothetical protein SFV54_02895, partial [Bryobacteraceae bacterium]|nr:hypothetical protein [Bryobacteraceae bacterium]
ATLDYINRHQALAHRHLHRDLDQLRALQRDHLEGRVPDDTYNFDRPAAPQPTDQPCQPSPASPPPHPVPAPAPTSEPLQPAAAPPAPLAGNPAEILPAPNPRNTQVSSDQSVNAARDTAQNALTPVCRLRRHPLRFRASAPRRLLATRRRRR